MLQQCYTEIVFFLLSVPEYQYNKLSTSDISFSVSNMLENEENSYHTVETVPKLNQTLAETKGKLCP